MFLTSISESAHSMYQKKKIIVKSLLGTFIHLTNASTYSSICIKKTTTVKQYSLLNVTESEQQRLALQQISPVEIRLIICDAHL